LPRSEKGNLSQGEIKMRILGYLYNRGETGANLYTIEHRANIPSQEFNRFRGFLEELCSLSLLTKYEEEIGRDKTRAYYKITQKGKEIVDIYRRSVMPKIFGSIDDLFGLKKEKKDKD
jgi:predicted transcriptional regulator